jgi:transcriptional regulator with GAF, ATPase, and Fis domain
VVTEDVGAGREASSGLGLGPEQAASDEDDLRSALGGLAAMVAGSLAVDELLGLVAGFAVQAVPGVDGAAVTLLRPPDGGQRIQSWAVTAEFVGEIDVLQYEVLGEGPCLTCMQTRRPVVSGSLGSDGRWPRFGPRVAEWGVHSALSLPLLVADELIGAINSFAHRHDVFGEHAMRLGELFAVPAAVSVHNALLLQRTRKTVEHLQRALVSRAVIDQAIGIIRSRTGDSAEEAFDRLRYASQSENIRVAVIAQQLLDESVRRARLGRHQS